MIFTKKLTDDVIHAWVLTLIDEYEKIRNGLTEISKLRLPNFSINDNLTRTLGTWDTARRTITFSEQLLLQGTWDDVIAVLKHEMAHQIVVELFGIRNEEPHGIAFKKACGLLNIPAGACYTFSGLVHSAQSNLLKRIEKLLALGQSSNQHEAERALAKAHELSLKYNIALNEKKKKSVYALRLVGPLVKRTPSYLWMITKILEDFYFVKYIQRPCGWRSSTNGYSTKVIELYGTLENLDLAEYVYCFLLNHGKLEWQRYQGERKLTHNKFKVSFLKGMYAGYYEKLQERHQELAEDHGLIWIGDSGLNGFYKQRNPQVKTVKNTTMVDRESHKAGQQVGRTLEIKPGLETSRKGHPCKPHLLNSHPSN